MARGFHQGERSRHRRLPLAASPGECCRSDVSRELSEQHQGTQWRALPCEWEKGLLAGRERTPSAGVPFNRQGALQQPKSLSTAEWLVIDDSWPITWRLPHPSYPGGEAPRQREARAIQRLSCGWSSGWRTTGLHPASQASPWISACADDEVCWAFRGKGRTEAATGIGGSAARRAQGARRMRRSAATGRRRTRAGCSGCGRLRAGPQSSSLVSR